MRPGRALSPARPYLDVGSMTNSLAVADLLYTSFSVKSSFRDDIFRAGLNYKIDVN